MHDQHDQHDEPTPDAVSPPLAQAPPSEAPLARGAVTVSVDTQRRSRRAVAAITLRALLDASDRVGIDVPRVLERVGLTRETVDDADAWVPVDTLIKVWSLLLESTDDPDFGLHVGEQTPAGAYGALEFAAISSPTALAAVERVVRYYAMICAMSEMAVENDGEVVRLVLRPLVATSPEIARHHAEHWFAMLALRARMFARDGLSALAVRFVHPAPEKTTEHARIFRAPVEFGQLHNEIAIPRSALDMPFRFANPQLLAVLEENGATNIAPRPDDDIVETLRRAIGVAVRGGDAGLDAVARSLAMGGRTLQRRLKERGVHYADLVDDVRSEAAQKYVAEEHRSLTEVAFLLGFSDPSAFSRAFKRWTGKTPQAFRRQGPSAGTSSVG